MLSLFDADGFGWVDVGDVGGGEEESDEADGHCAAADGKVVPEVDVDGNEGHGVAFGVEVEDVELSLQQAEDEGQKVSDNDADADDASGLDEENAPDGAVGGSEGFKNAYHGGFLENHDEQSRDDGGGAYESHDGEDEDDVGVEELKPSEHGGLLFAYGTDVDVGRGGIFDVVESFVEPVEVVDKDFVACHLG